MTTTEAKFDAVETAVIANRIDGIIREMTGTLLRAGRSAVINSARDFSCAICTADNQLLACAEGLPIHIFGINEQARAMTRFHPDLAEGDAFLHNDPYTGGSHPADHAFLVPVFLEGEHLFTTAVKAHQADIGNSIATTYHASAKDIYEEGALIFPAVRVQRNYETIGDIVRMCERRIRVPEQWYGDFLAGLGAARVAERRLKDLCAKYGKARLKDFIANWLDYSEQRMIHALRKMPKARLVNTGRHDPIEPFLPDGLDFTVVIEVDPDHARVTVDLTDNPPNLDCGLNMSEACSVSAALAGLFNSLDLDIPKNSGSFRRIDLRLGEGRVIGKPKFPHSCSVATTNIADRLVNCVGAAFAQLGAGHGVAEGALGMNAADAVVSGYDDRHGGPFVNQLILSVNGGPASALADGWVTYGLPVCSGLMYRDSVEIDELKMPIELKTLRLIPGTAGAGRHRGVPSCEVAYGPREHPITVIYPCDGQFQPPKGVLGGQDGLPAGGWHVGSNGYETKLPNAVQTQIRKGELIRSRDCSSGGYGDPLQRDPRRVLHDVLERWETLERAREVYGVAFTGSVEAETLAIDIEETARLRAPIVG